MAKKAPKMSDRKRRLINKKISIKAAYRKNNKLREKLKSKDLTNAELKKLTNQYLNKNVELNTELDELQTKLNRVSKKKAIKYVYEPSEGTDVIETDYRAWDKQEFSEEIFEDSGITEVNGFKKNRDADKVLDLIHSLSLDMTSKDVYKYEIDFETGKIFIYIES